MTGPQGPQGSPGAKGADGADGAPGLSAYDLYLQNTTDDPVLTLPKWQQSLHGQNGAQGPKGDPGATGAQGAQGPKGDTGTTGAQGPKGDTGASGAPAGANTIVVQAQNNDGTTVTVGCPGDHPVAVGGGASTDNSSNTVQINIPATITSQQAHGWQGLVHKANGGSNGTTTVYALCALTS